MRSNLLRRQPDFRGTATIIVREVEYTEPAVKGDTSGKVMKTARLVGGTEIQVMSYVENGDKIEIDTRTGEFRKRA